MKIRSRTIVGWAAGMLVALMIPIGATEAQEGPAGTSAARPPSAANGRSVYYNQLCYGCHGFTGESRVSLLGSPMLTSEQAFVTYLRLRGDEPPSGPSTGMPNFSENVLSDADARDLYAYVRTFRSTARSLEDIPTLNTIIEAASRPYQPE